MITPYKKFEKHTGFINSHTHVHLYEFMVQEEEPKEGLVHISIVSV